MAFVRYQSPDDPAYLVFDQARFRVNHAIFLLKVGPLKDRIGSKIEERRDWNLVAMKLVGETQRLESALNWLKTIGDDPDLVVLPELKHEPAIDLVADELIAEGEYVKTFCPACEAEYQADQVTREPWNFEEDGVTVRGRKSTCLGGHTIHALTDGIDAPDLEMPDEQGPNRGPLL